MHYLAVWLGAFLAVALSAIVWHVASAGGPVASLSPGLGAVLAKMNDAALIAHSAASFRTLAAGFAAAAVAGIVLGLAIGLAEGSRRLLGPVVAALAALPMVMATPLIVLHAGVGFGTIAAVVFLAAVFPIADAMIATLDRPPLPSTNGAAPQPQTGLSIVSGLRAGFVFAVIGLVVSEFFIGREGLGFAAMNATAMFDTTTAVAATLLLFAMASVLFALLRSAEMMLERNGR